MCDKAGINLALYVINPKEDSNSCLLTGHRASWMLLTHLVVGLIPSLEMACLKTF